VEPTESDGMLSGSRPFTTGMPVDPLRQGASVALGGMTGGRRSRWSAIVFPTLSVVWQASRRRIWLERYALRKASGAARQRPLLARIERQTWRVLKPAKRGPKPQRERMEG